MRSPSLKYLTGPLPKSPSRAPDARVKGLRRLNSERIDRDPNGSEHYFDQVLRPSGAPSYRGTMVYFIMGLVIAIQQAFFLRL